jgi:hypothetical protein
MTYPPRPPERPMPPVRPDFTPQRPDLPPQRPDYSHPPLPGRPGRYL